MGRHPTRRYGLGIVRGSGGVLIGAFGVIGILVGNAAALTVAVVIGLVGGLAALGLAQDRQAQRSRLWKARRSLMWAAVLMWSVFVGIGLVGVFGPAAVPIAVALLGTVAAGIWWRRRSGAPVGPTSELGAPGPVGVDVDLRAMPDRQLAREWRRSHSQLAGVRNAAELGAVVAMRRRQLDEMERRDPAGCRRWLASGGWVRSDSAPFLGC